MNRAALLVMIGCGKHLNPEWCEQPEHTDPACPREVDIDAAPPVSCTIDADCPGTMCLPSGVCADPDPVRYASPQGMGSACSSTAACDLATAIKGATKDHQVIRLVPGVYVGAVTIDRDVQIIGSQATLAAAATGDAVAVTGNAKVELDDLTIQGAVDASGLLCTAGATLVAHRIRVTSNGQGITSACGLTLDRSVLSANTEGALDITAGTIDIRNNVIAKNGNPMLKKTGNVTIAAGVTGSFVFNTVARNDAKQNGIPGVRCAASDVATEGNLITENTRRGAFDGGAQVMGKPGCDFLASYTEPGTGNNDPAWASVDALDFHLTDASALAIDHAGTTCGTPDDIDGETRPDGAGCDLGADERHSP
jgi:hypothetical protein